MPMKVVCFTKNRPMQFDAYMSSLFHYTNIDPKNVIIITPNMSFDDEEYRDLFIGKYNNCLYVNESINGFDDAVRFIVDRLIDDNDFVNFATDDTLFTDHVNFDDVANTIDGSILGFSLRLGENTLGYNRVIDKAEKEDKIAWGWGGSMSHWGYPIDLSCSVYPSNVFKDIVNYSKEILPIPNSIESRGVNLCYKGYFGDKLWMSSYKKSKMVICDLNRVQDLFPNRTQGDENTSPAKLKNMFREGYRINWQKYAGMLPDDPFIGMKNLEFVKNGSS